jgi:ferredoxin-NADP reductase
MPEAICFICTGTGVAPFRSMLWELSKHPEKAPILRLIFGTKTMEKVLFWDEWQSFIQLFPDFRIHIALSGVENLPPDNFPYINFYKGHVHQVYLHRGIIDLHKSVFYLCGWQNMIDEAQKKLFHLGLPQTNIRTELFG